MGVSWRGGGVVSCAEGIGSGGYWIWVTRSFVVEVCQSLNYLTVRCR